MAMQSQFSTATSVSEELSDWELQLLEIAEAEKWEGSLYKIPKALQNNFKVLMDTINLQNRVASYKLLDLLGWDEHYCSVYYTVLKNTRPDLVCTLIDLWKKYSSNLPVLKILIEWLLRCSSALIDEFIADFSEKEIEGILDMIRFLSLHEIDLMVHSMEIMKLRGFMNMVKICSDNKINQCRLCKSKRIWQLEFKMQQKTLPKDLLPLTGTLVLHEQVQDQWVADDDLGYEFDITNGSVYWHKKLVDVVRICEKCLTDVHQALSAESRFVEVFHIESNTRKEMITDLRRREQARTKFIEILAIEREHRRAKEIAVRVLAAHKHGTRLEKDAMEKQERDAARNATFEAERRNRKELDAAVLSTDVRWKQNEYISNVKYLYDLNDRVNMNLHPGFSKDNPVSTQREHPHSWQLQHYDTTTDPLVNGQSANICSTLQMPGFSSSSVVHKDANQGMSSRIGAGPASGSGRGVELPQITNGANGMSLISPPHSPQGAAPRLGGTGSGSRQPSMVLPQPSFRAGQSVSTASGLPPYLLQTKPLPLTYEGAGKRFGLDTFKTQENLQALTEWKEKGEMGHEEHLRRVERLAREKREKEKSVFEERVDYVGQRIRDINRRNMRERRHREQAEVDRVEKRAEDRIQRKHKRLAGYEARERAHMSYEDEQGWWSRYFAKEAAIAARERENMFNEECEQTAVDNFWGLFTQAMREQQLRELRQKKYEEKVESMRVKCVQSYIIKPYEWEAKDKTIHDFFTDKPIT